MRRDIIEMKNAAIESEENRVTQARVKRFRSANEKCEKTKGGACVVNNIYSQDDFRQRKKERPRVYKERKITNHWESYVQDCFYTNARVVKSTVRSKIMPNAS